MISKATKMEERIPVAAVVGPTASGKSWLAVELALRYDGRWSQQIPCRFIPA